MKIINASKQGAALRVPGVGAVAYGDTIEVSKELADALLAGGQFKAASTTTKPKAAKTAKE